MSRSAIVRFLGTSGLAYDRQCRRERQTGFRPGETALPGTNEFGFVGRDDELIRLQAALDSAIGGAGRIVMLAGPPGIGKTRLGRELTGRAAGVAVFWGRCSEEQGAPPFWPWIQVIRASVAQQSIAATRRDLGTGADDLAMLVPELREGEPESWIPALPGGPLDLGQARFRLFQSVATFAGALTHRQPVLLVLDDLHWADQPSLRLLEFLGQSIGTLRLLIVGTYRDDEITRSHPLTDTLGELVKSPAFERIELTGLARSAVQRMIVEASATDPAGSLVRAVHDQTEGNPLFLGEIVRLLLQEGVLTGRPASGGPGDPPSRPDQERRRAFRIPAGIRETIARRLNRLSDRCSEILAMASVIGREFGLAELSYLVPAGADLLPALDEAVGARVIEVLSLSPLRFQFSHALIRETIYDDLSTTGRLQLHGQIAAVIEMLSGSNLDPRLDEIAYHYGMAIPVTGPAKAIEFAERAGDRAMAMLAHEAALPHYELALRAIDLLDPGESVQRCRLLLSFGHAQLYVGRLEEAMVTFRRVVDNARRANAGEILARAAFLIEDMGWNFVQEQERPIAMLTQALANLDPADSEIRSSVLSALARCHFALDDSDRGRTYMHQAIAMARRLDDPPALINSLRNLLFVLWEPGVIEEFVGSGARQLLFQAERQSSGKLIQLLGLSYGHVCDLLTGDLTAFDRDTDRYGALADELRIPMQRYHIPVIRAMRATMNGNFGEAELQATEALRLGQREGLNAVPAGAYGLQMFTIRREQGRLREIAPLVEQFVRLHPESSTWRPGLALIYREIDREPEARAVFEQLATNAFRDIPRDALWCLTMVYLAEVCAYLGDAPRAALLSELLLPYAAYTVVGGNRAVCLGAVSHFLGLLAVTLGRPEDAARHFEHALAFNERLGARPALAHSQVAYAQLLLTGGSRQRAAALLDQALGTARDLGMTTLEARIGAHSVSVRPRRRPANPAGLSDRELEVLRRLAAGRSNQEIADDLVLSIFTVLRHVTHIYTKIGAANRTEATAFAIRLGLDR